MQSIHELKTVSSELSRPTAFLGLGPITPKEADDA